MPTRERHLEFFIHKQLGLLAHLDLFKPNQLFKKEFKTF